MMFIIISFVIVIVLLCAFSAWQQDSETIDKNNPFTKLWKQLNDDLREYPNLTDWKYRYSYRTLEHNYILIHPVNKAEIKLVNDEISGSYKLSINNVCIRCEKINTLLCDFVFEGIKKREQEKLSNLVNEFVESDEGKIERVSKLLEEYKKRK